MTPDTPETGMCQGVRLRNRVRRGKVAVRLAKRDTQLAKKGHPTSSSPGDRAFSFRKPGEGQIAGFSLPVKL